MRRRATNSPGPSASSRRSNIAWRTYSSVECVAIRRVGHGAVVVSAASPDAHRDALAASHTASAAYRFVAGQGIQLHGGIGFTWEHDAHLHYKRAISSAKLLESESDRVEALLRSPRVGDRVAPQRAAHPPDGGAHTPPEKP